MSSDMLEKCARAIGRLLCKVWLHRWERVFEERFYGDARLVADFRRIDRCSRCDRLSETWGRTNPPYHVSRGGE